MNATFHSIDPSVPEIGSLHLTYLRWVRKEIAGISQEPPCDRMLPATDACYAQAYRRSQNAGTDSFSIILGPLPSLTVKFTLTAAPGCYWQRYRWIPSQIHSFDLRLSLADTSLRIRTDYSATARGDSARLANSLLVRYSSWITAFPFQRKD